MMAPISILMTGGTGFLGRSLLRRWAQEAKLGRQYQVSILTRHPVAFIDHYPEFANLPWLTFHKGDIRDPTSLPWGQTFSHILHAAADSTIGTQLAPLTRYDQIVSGTRALLDYAAQGGGQRFLFVSSGGAYGPQPQNLDRIPEEWNGMPDPLDPASAYGVAKRAAEHLCALYSATHGLTCVIARCFAFVGADLPLDVHFAIGNFIRDALWRDIITVHGDGQPLRSYLAQEDLAHWLDVLLINGQPNRAYNVGSDRAIRIVDLAHLVRDILAPGKTVVVQAKPDPNKGQRNIYVPSIDRARRELGLEATVSLEDAIAATGRAALEYPEISNQLISSSLNPR